MDKVNRNQIAEFTIDQRWRSVTLRFRISGEDRTQCEVVEETFTFLGWALTVAAQTPAEDGRLVDTRLVPVILDAEGDVCTAREVAGDMDWHGRGSFEIVRLSVDEHFPPKG